MQNNALTNIWTLLCGTVWILFSQIIRKHWSIYVEIDVHTLKRGYSKAAAYLYLLSREVFRAPEDVALGDALAAQLVHLHHSPERDQPDEGALGQQRQRHLQGLLQTTETSPGMALLEQRDVKTWNKKIIVIVLLLLCFTGWQHYCTVVYFV